MISYTFSKREKVLLVILAVILIAIAWYMLVYRNTAAQIASIDSEIAMTRTEIDGGMARVAQIDQMQQEIDESKSEGITPKKMPTYDNLQPLVDELNGIMSMTNTYTLTFDKLDMESGDYVRRGVLIAYGCGSYDAAEAVVNALVNGTYPCAVDSVSIVDSGARATVRAGSSGSGASTVSASVHVTFFEKK